MKREEIVEAMARAIRVEMGPVFGTPEYLARPGNVERLEARQQSAADKWAEAALTALEARGLAVVKVPPGHAIMFAKMDEPGASSTALLTASKDDPNV